MDDFSVVGDTFEGFYIQLEKVLQWYAETNLVLNWEKCYFMVKEGIDFRHKILGNGLQVDKAKLHVISKLPPPISVKWVRSFLRHVSFCKRFIKNFANIANSLHKLLERIFYFISMKHFWNVLMNLKRGL